MNASKNTFRGFRILIVSCLICGLAYSGAFAWDTDHHGQDVGIGFGIAVTAIVVAAIVASTIRHYPQPVVARRPYGYYDDVFRTLPSDNVERARPVVHDTVYVK